MNTQTLLQELFKAGLTQLDLARITGIPQPRISRWASGDVPHSVDDVFALQKLQKRYCKKRVR